MLKKCPKILTNSLIGVFASIISTFSTYVIRIVISHSLGDEIYGVNSIFISIVSVFLILELGMSTAMIIILYKPVVEEEHEKIKSIILFYKKFYRIFCLILFIMGLIVSIFLLKYFINTSIDFIYVQLYFYLYLISIICKYLWSYKISLLYSNKQNNVVSIITIIVTIIFSVLEIICIILFKIFWLYLIIFALQNVTINVICNIYINKKYTYIIEKDVLPLDIITKKRIIEIIRPMFIQRLANQLQDASSVVIYSAIGTDAKVVGYFSNYVMVVHACQTIFNQIGAAFTTSFGCFYASNKDKIKQFEYYKTTRFYMSWVAIIFSTLYLCLIQSFIKIFFGEDNCMSNIIAILFALYVFIILNNIVNISVQNAVGAHYLDSKEMIFQTILGIIFSITFGILFGAKGIILGLVMSIIIFSSIVKGIKIFKNLFNVSAINHILLLLKETFCFCIISSITYYTYVKFLKPNGIIEFLVSAVIIFIISNVGLLIINIRSNNLLYVKSFIKNFLKKSLQ